MILKMSCQFVFLEVYSTKAEVSNLISVLGIRAGPW